MRTGVLQCLTMTGLMLLYTVTESAMQPVDTDEGTVALDWATKINANDAELAADIAEISDKLDTVEIAATTDQDAGDVPVEDLGAYWSGLNVEAVLAEIGVHWDALITGEDLDLFTLDELESSEITLTSSASLDFRDSGAMSGGFLFDSNNDGTGITFHLGDSTSNVSVDGGDYSMKIPPRDRIITVSTDTEISGATCRGGIVNVTAAATITACDDLEDGMSFTVRNYTASAINTKAQSDDRIILVSATTSVLDDGDQATSSTLYASITCEYESTDGWFCEAKDHVDGGQ